MADIAGDGLIDLFGWAGRPGGSGGIGLLIALAVYWFFEIADWGITRDTGDAPGGLGKQAGGMPVRLHHHLDTVCGAAGVRLAGVAA